MEKPIQKAIADEIRSPGAFMWFLLGIIFIIMAASVEMCGHDHEDCQHTESHE